MPAYPSVLSLACWSIFKGSFLQPPTFEFFKKINILCKIEEGALLKIGVGAVKTAASPFLTRVDDIG